MKHQKTIKTLFTMSANLFLATSIPLSESLSTKILRIRVQFPRQEEVEPMIVRLPASASHVRIRYTDDEVTAEIETEEKYCLSQKSPKFLSAIARRKQSNLTIPDIDISDKQELGNICALSDEDKQELDNICALSDEDFFSVCYHGLISHLLYKTSLGTVSKIDEYIKEYIKACSNGTKLSNSMFENEPLVEYFHFLFLAMDEWDQMLLVKYIETVLLMKDELSFAIFREHGEIVISKIMAIYLTRVNCKNGFEYADWYGYNVKYCPLDDFLRFRTPHLFKVCNEEDCQKIQQTIIDQCTSDEHRNHLARYQDLAGLITNGVNLSNLLYLMNCRLSKPEYVKKALNNIFGSELQEGAEWYDDEFCIPKPEHLHYPNLYDASCKCAADLEMVKHLKGRPRALRGAIHDLLASSQIAYHSGYPGTFDATKFRDTNLLKDNMQYYSLSNVWKIRLHSLITISGDVNRAISYYIMYWVTWQFSLKAPQIESLLKNNNPEFSYDFEKLDEALLFKTIDTISRILASQNNEFNFHGFIKEFFPGKKWVNIFLGIALRLQLESQILPYMSEIYEILKNDLSKFYPRSCPREKLICVIFTQLPKDTLQRLKQWCVLNLNIPDIKVKLNFYADSLPSMLTNCTTETLLVDSFETLLTKIHSLLQSAKTLKYAEIFNEAINIFVGVQALYGIDDEDSKEPFKSEDEAPRGTFMMNALMQQLNNKYHGVSQIIIKAINPKLLEIIKMFKELPTLSFDDQRLMVSSISCLLEGLFNRFTHGPGLSKQRATQKTKQTTLPIEDDRDIDALVAAIGDNDPKGKQNKSHTKSKQNKSQNKTVTDMADAATSIGDLRTDDDVDTDEEDADDFALRLVLMLERCRESNSKRVAELAEPFCKRLEKRRKQMEFKKDQRLKKILIVRVNQQAEKIYTDTAKAMDQKIQLFINQNLFLLLLFASIYVTGRNSAEFEPKGRFIICNEARGTFTAAFALIELLGLSWTRKHVDPNYVTPACTSKPEKVNQFIAYTLIRFSIASRQELSKRISQQILTPTSRDMFRTVFSNSTNYLVFDPKEKNITTLQKEPLYVKAYLGPAQQLGESIAHCRDIPNRKGHTIYSILGSQYCLLFYTSEDYEYNENRVFLQFIGHVDDRTLHLVVCNTRLRFFDQNNNPLGDIPIYIFVAIDTIKKYKGLIDKVVLIIGSQHEMRYYLNKVHRAVQYGNTRIAGTQISPAEAIAKLQAAAQYDPYAPK